MKNKEKEAIQANQGEPNHQPTPGHDSKMAHLLLRAATAILQRYCQQITIQSIRQRRITGQLIVMLLGMQAQSDARREVDRLEKKMALETKLLATTEGSPTALQVKRKERTKKLLKKAKKKLIKADVCKIRYKNILNCKKSLKKAFSSFCCNWYTWRSQIVILNGDYNAFV